jgi:hypothetical protein
MSIQSVITAYFIRDFVDVVVRALNATAKVMDSNPDVQ